MGVFLVSWLSAISLILFFKDDVLKDIESEQILKRKKEMSIYSIFFIVISVIVALFVIEFDTKNWFACKELAFLSIIWPLGYIDFKTYRIPNKFIVFGIICRVIILVFELFFNREGITSVLLGEGISVMLLAIAMALCRLIIKNSIGYGDIKLFLLMGLFLGAAGTWNAVFCALCFSFLISIVLLISKKKTRKDVIPFAPAIVIGTYFSIIFTEM